MQTKRFNQKNTAKFVYKIRAQFPGYRIDLVCDNAPWHNGKLVKKALSKTNIHEHRLPPYSPQMNASEYFIRWAKEILSYNFCWKDLHSLKYSFRGFVASLSRKANEVIQRCKPKCLVSVSFNYNSCYVGEKKRHKNPQKSRYENMKNLWGV